MKAEAIFYHQGQIEQGIRIWTRTPEIRVACLAMLLISRSSGERAYCIQMFYLAGLPEPVVNSIYQSLDDPTIVKRPVTEIRQNRV